MGEARYFFCQIQMLLNEKRVNEALQLAHVAMETLTGPQRDEKVSCQVD